MTPGTLEPWDVPGVLDLPVARRQEEAADQRPPSLAGDWLPALAHDAEPHHPVGMLAAAGEWPSSVDAPAARRRLGRPHRLGRAGKDHVLAALVDPLVGFPRQRR